MTDGLNVLVAVLFLHSDDIAKDRSRRKNRVLTGSLCGAIMEPMMVRHGWSIWRQRMDGDGHEMADDGDPWRAIR
jgi:hypothetical protein